MAPLHSDRISPTAHYTSYVWFANGLSYPELATSEGRMLYHAMRPMMAASRAIGGPTLDGVLLARHRIIDRLLDDAIEAGRIGQVIEVAAGLSGRGRRFVERHGERVTYIEADLPGMAARKRALLGTLVGDRHRVVDIDALAADGPASIGAIAAGLDPSRGTAIVTEGLLNYFDRAAVTGMWARFAAALRGFSAGLYVSDLHLAETNRSPLLMAASMMLGVAVRGRVHLHFRDPGEARRALQEAGFAHSELHHPEAWVDRIGPIEPASAALVRIVEAHA
jgi:O-methyltransferase involved in polyketide biosynthesis